MLYKTYLLTYLDSELSAIYQEEVKEVTKGSSSLSQLASGSDIPVRNLIIDF